LLFLIKFFQKRILNPEVKLDKASKKKLKKPPSGPGPTPELPRAMERRKKSRAMEGGPSKRVPKSIEVQSCQSSFGFRFSISAPFVWPGHLQIS
jgi:hypothetical protein